jgi:hypothetical protein
MLVEIETLLLKTLKGNLSNVPDENIVMGGVAPSLPAVVLMNFGFRFTPEIIESTQPRIQVLKEDILLKVGESSYKFKNPPIENSTTLEESSAKLKEGEDFTIDYKRNMLNLEETRKSSRKLTVNYSSRADSIAKRMKLEAKYLIDVYGKEWNQVDAIAEQIVSMLISSDDEFRQEGIRIIPKGGRTTNDEKDRRKLQMAYVFEREMVVETAVPVIRTIIPTIKQLEVSKKPEKE